MSNIAVITTFPNNSFDIYSRQMLESFVKYWPGDIPLMVELDDDLLYDQVNKILRPEDGIAIGWSKEHKEFAERNKDKDDPQNYRKQAVRFCHKVFAIQGALEATQKAKAAGAEVPRYLIWLDADVITNRPVTLDEIKECLPKEGDAVSYMGRKDWDHSECGWLAFDLESGSDRIIYAMQEAYIKDIIFNMDQWHDSWLFDHIKIEPNRTNLTLDKRGMDIWPQSPMGKWSTHYKGPVAKKELYEQKAPVRNTQGNARSNVIIQTKNAIPSEQIQSNITENQKLITNWVRECKPTNEELVMVSAGPMLIAEELREEVAQGRKIVAVKHAIKPLVDAGIKVWATILLDPRPHVLDFVDKPDTSVIWFVASQVNPEVTKKLLDSGCKVVGYHASVGAGEAQIIKKQQHAIISGGSATATRGMYLMHHLGFKHFRLYGYELCYPDKPDLSKVGDEGQPKYLEVSLSFQDGDFLRKKCFWTEPQLLAQFEEINEIIKMDKFGIEAFGEGIVPFMLNSKKLSDLRNKELTAKLTGGKDITYKELLWPVNSTTNWRKWLPRILPNRNKNSRLSTL